MIESNGKTRTFTAITPDGKSVTERTSARVYTKAICIITDARQSIYGFSAAAKPKDPCGDNATMAIVPTFIIDRWYDRETKSWVVQLKDLDENQIGDAVYVGSKAEAKKINQMDFDQKGGE